MNIKNLFKKFCSVGLALSVVATTSITAFADEFSFNMEKSRQTYGGGDAFAIITRLNDTKRDRNNFSPLWLTENSTIEVDYITSGQYQNSPVHMVLQTWPIDKNPDQEKNNISLEPTSFNETHATFNYADIDAVWPYADFSNMYGISFGDNDNSLLITSVVATNCNIPDELVPDSIKNGTVTLDDIKIDINGEIIPEETTTEAVEETEETEGTTESVPETANNEEVETEPSQTEPPENDLPKDSPLANKTSPKSESENDVEVVSEEVAEEEVEDSNSTSTTGQSSDEVQKSSSNLALIIILSGSGALIVIILIIVLITNKNKKSMKYKKFK